MTRADSPHRTTDPGDVGPTDRREGVPAYPWLRQHLTRRLPVTWCPRRVRLRHTPGRHGWPSLVTPACRPGLPRTSRTEQAIPDDEIADVKPDIWPDHQLAEQKLTAWQVLCAGFELSLPTPREFQQRIRAIVQTQGPGTPPTHER
jgi:hypothetical protein